MPRSKRYRLQGYRLLSVMLLAAMMLSLHGLLVQAQPAPLRRVDPVSISTQVYGQLSDISFENHYIDQATGAPAVDNTLVSRIIRYHIYTKQRPTNLRLAWKLTLADYMGAFENMVLEAYPTDGLQVNPMAGDIAHIQSLSRDLRDRLVNTLYETFTATSVPTPPAAHP